MSNYTIQTGFWVNHDFSPVVGATLTISIRWGNYLIAALSSLVAWAGSRAWAILYFYLHQRLARKQEKEDVLQQQMQVHYRAAGSFFDSLVDGIDLHRAWSGRVKRVKRRTLGLAIGAVLFFVAFAAAGILVAEVASQSNQDVLVLASPNDCGDLMFQDSVQYHNEYVDTYMGYTADVATWARNYARDAYNGSKARFDAFPSATLPMSGREVPCPFTNGTTCLGVNATKGANAWLMESGPLDSHQHFGMNAPVADRITFSKSVTCAVVDAQNLTIKPYWRVERIRGREVNKTYIGILQEFGEDIGYDSNLVFEIPESLVNTRVGFYNQRGLYSMGLHNPQKDLTGPPFLRYDADVVLSAISQSQMFYYAPVDDPMFLAHEAQTGEEYAIDMNVTVYYPSAPFGLMSCAEQVQTCNPTTGACTNPNGTVGWAEQLARNDIGLNSAQLATAFRIYNSFDITRATFGSFVARGGNGLLVAESRGVRAGQSIGPTQWQTEANLWFATSLTAVQSGLMTWVVKPWLQGRPETTFPRTVLNMTTLDALYDARGLAAAKATLCSNQLIHSAAAMQNFSVLALTLVITLCLFIIILAWVLPCCVTASRDRQRRKEKLSAQAEAGEVARLADGKYSLLAMALANAGVGQWERGKADIPVTKSRLGLCRPLERKDSGLAAYPCVECGVCRVKTLVDTDSEKGAGSSTSSVKDGSVKKVKLDSEVCASPVDACDEKKQKKEEQKEYHANSKHDKDEKTRESGSFERIRRCGTEKTLVGPEK